MHKSAEIRNDDATEVAPLIQNFIGNKETYKMLGE